MPEIPPSVLGHSQRPLLVLHRELILSKKNSDLLLAAKLVDFLHQIREEGIVPVLSLAANDFLCHPFSANYTEESRNIASIMLGLFVLEKLEKMGHTTRVLSGILVAQLCEPFNKWSANDHLKKGRVVICVAGAGGKNLAGMLERDQTINLDNYF